MIVCSISVCFLFFNDTATTEIYTLSLHDALPIFNFRKLASHQPAQSFSEICCGNLAPNSGRWRKYPVSFRMSIRSEEHTSELQSRQYLVCRLLLEKKHKHRTTVLVVGPRDHSVHQ